MIEGKGRKGRAVAERLDFVAEGMGIVDLKAHRRHELMPPQHVGALPDDRDLNIFGGEIVGLGRRERSRDRGLLPRHHQHRHRHFDRRIIEERAFEDLGPNVDEELAFRAERALVIQEDQRGRMMQFDMGHRCVDPLDFRGRGMGERRLDHLGVHGIGIGEPHAMARVGRFPLVEEVEYDI